MKKFEITNENGNIQIEFNGEEWIIDEDFTEDTELTIAQNLVEESPFQLYRILDEIGDADNLIEEISQKSSEMKKLFDDFRREKTRLNQRTVLYSKYGVGLFDEFTDILAISSNLDEGLMVETTIEDHSFDEELGSRNALGEIKVESSGNIFTARQLYDAILSATSDGLDRWERIDWTWDEIIANLAFDSPKLAEELEELVKTPNSDDLEKKLKTNEETK